ncbi:hypothetical protein H4219_004221 [Mycoemilia scoparia]|uniref:F-box domain-containing protein n=1 Tax=Mycoemilia scoparia TaxID=417184 RepID=A0A9W7ZY16_9FUNG|nr:hypothetical protein H4219_004221 [Mycoemilia scoparia]
MPYYLPSELKYKICSNLNRADDKFTLEELKNVSLDWHMATMGYLFGCISNKDQFYAREGYTANYYKCNPNDIKKHYQMVKTISIEDYRGGQIPPEAQKWLMNYPNLKYVEINSPCKNSSYVRDIMHQNQQISSLCLSEAIEYGLHSFADYGKLDKLKSLKIRDSFIRIRIFDILDCYPALEELDVSTHDPLVIESAEVNSSDQIKTYPNLKSLKIEFKAPQEHNQFLSLKSIQRAFPNLQTLGYLTTESVGLPMKEPQRPGEVFILDSPFIGLTTHQFKYLTKLSLLYLTEYSAKLIGLYMPSLEHLIIHGFSIMDKKWMTKGYQYLLTKSNLLSLKTLIFDFDGYGNEDLNIEIFKVSPYERPLEKLSASNVISVNLPAITYLGLGTLNLNPRILFVLEQFPVLEKLSIKFDSFDGIETLIHSHHIPSVHILEVRLSSMIQDVHKFPLLLNIFPNVKVVRVFGLYNQFINLLKEKFEDVVFIRDDEDLYYPKRIYYPPSVNSFNNYNNMMINFTSAFDSLRNSLI